MLRRNRVVVEKHGVTTTPKSVIYACVSGTVGPSLGNFGNSADQPSVPVEKEPKSMRIVVDLNRCLGYVQCVPLAPEVLQLQGEEALAYDPNPDDSQRQQVARAVASCPVQAIIAEMDPPADRTTK
jgi:ferredoxin